MSTVEFYWRPGCGFCAGLERDLTRAGITLNKHNIWEDPTAAEFVRSVNKGNELVPTVVANGAAMSNPRADQVIAALA